MDFWDPIIVKPLPTTLASTFLVMPTSSIPLHTYIFQIQPLRLSSSEMMLQHQSFQWIFRGLVWSPCCPRDFQESSPAPQFKSINFLVLSLFLVQLSHPYITTRKTIPLTRWTFVGKVMSLLFNILSRFVIAFLQSGKHLLITWLQSHLQWFWSLRK